MARIDHTNCTHPRTPAGRRACRAQSEMAVPPVPTAMEMERGRARTARKLARHAAAADRMRARTNGIIQASRDLTYANCVQAELHTGKPGTVCACGWRA